MKCIWITIDSLRQDHLRCYRPEGTVDDSGESLLVETPNIDRLAAEGTTFDRMRAEALPTVPCRRGFFTGRRVFPWPDEPFYKGIPLRFPGWRPVPQDDVTVAEHLAEQGYVTALVTDVWHLMKPSMNFHRGFASFQFERGQEADLWQSGPLPDGALEQYIKPDIPLPPERLRVLSQWLRNQMHRETDGDFQAARTFGRAVEWLERNHTHEKFFLYVDSFAPHEPFEAPQQYVDRYDPGWDGPKLIYANLYRRDQLTDAEHRHVRARYAASVSFVDHWVGRLLDAVDRLGLRESTLIVLVSDHGKIIGEFGRYGMPAECIGPALSPVPCIVRHPGGEHAGVRFGGWLYNTDVTVTVLNRLGVAPKPRTDGADVWPAVGSGAGAFRDHLVTAYSHMTAAWRDDWLYLHNGKTGTAALYDLADDIHRKTDVAGRHPDVRDELARRLTQAGGPCY